MNRIEHFDLQLPFGKIHAVRKNSTAATPMLCIHGWLDNLASFYPMMAQLQEIDCVAVDLAGHGRSTHRSLDSLYHYIDNVRDIKLIIDALGWEKCHLVGHSMGGSLSLMTAVAFPETILSLTMIDSLHPLSRTADQGPAMLRRSMHQHYRWSPGRATRFPDLDAAVAARLKTSHYPPKEEHARLIMDYATRPEGDALQLRSDARLNFRSPLMLSQAQVESFISDPTLPILALLGSRGITHNRPHLEQTLTLFRNLRVHHLHGGHYIHMEHPATVTAIIREFLYDASAQFAV